MKEIKQIRDLHMDRFTEGDIIAHFRQMYFNHIEVQKNTAKQISDQYIADGHSRLVDGGQEGRQARDAN